MLDAALIAQLEGELSPCGSEASARAAALRDAGAPHTPGSDPEERCLVELSLPTTMLYARYWVEVADGEPVVHAFADPDRDGRLVHVVATGSGLTVRED